jgi:hypothetical protein
VQVLCRLDAARHGFGVGDLAEIEAAWVTEARDGWFGGFVARLGDGRRAYADGRAGPSHWSEDCDITAAMLDAGQSVPELAARQGGQTHAWDERVARGLNALLGQLP